MQNNSHITVIVATGGTIAGTAVQVTDTVAYQAAQLGVEQLVAAVPPLAAVPLEAVQLARLDSKDMDHATWQQLAQCVAAHLARPEVSGVVITHGTDTLEETAWFLHRVLAPAKPVVLTAAMRPATALLADGPQNLWDAVTVARSPGARGVVAVLGGQVHGPADVRKLHGHRLHAFSSGDAGPLAQLEDGGLRRWRDWPEGQALGLDWISAPVDQWPWVALLCSHAGADARMVGALLTLGVRGVVVEGTGNGTVHQALEQALRQAQAQGVVVWRASRCLTGGVMGHPTGALPSAGVLTPARARIELMLQLLRRPSA